MSSGRRITGRRNRRGNDANGHGRRNEGPGRNAAHCTGSGTSSPGPTCATSPNVSGLGRSLSDSKCCQGSREYEGKCFVFQADHFGFSCICMDCKLQNILRP